MESETRLQEGWCRTWSGSRLYASQVSAPKNDDIHLWSMEFDDFMLCEDVRAVFILPRAQLVSAKNICSTKSQQPF
jgi:hypothetical protein